MRFGDTIASGKTKNYIIQYVICTYGLFVLLMFTLGGIATVLLHGTPLVMRWLIAITAWTPTYVFLIMFKKLYPNRTVKDFYKKAFSKKLNIRLLTTTALMRLNWISFMWGILFIFTHVISLSNNQTFKYKESFFRVTVKKYGS